MLTLTRSVLFSVVTTAAVDGVSECATLSSYQYYSDMDEQRVLSELVNNTEHSRVWKCQWPEANSYTFLGGSRRINLNSLDSVKDFVLQFSQLNNCNFTVSSTRKNKDGTIYRVYRCHHGRHTKDVKITNTK